MTTATADIPTPNASRYLQQLCKHFGHKIPVEFTPTAGHIAFPFGTCRLAAEDGHLTLEAEAETPHIDKLTRVIGDHLSRFAFRENPTLTWHTA